MTNAAAKTTERKKKSAPQGTARTRPNRPGRPVDAGGSAAMHGQAGIVRGRTMRSGRPKAVAPPAPTFTTPAKRVRGLKKRAKG